jgi:hypothetical protein
LNKLPSLCLQIDYKIELTSENTLRHSPLYQQTTKELLVIKEYLIDNLDKGFIILSLAPFAASILFVKKPNRLLRFYVNY